MTTTTLLNGSHLCDICDLPCVSDRGVKVHKAKMHKTQPEDSQNFNFKDTLADKVVETQKMVDQQIQRPHVLCKGKTIKNVFRFSCLGTTFTADGDQHKDIQEKIGKAMSRCGKLRPILDSPDLCVSIKSRLYQSAVYSLLTYGCETWHLSSRAMRQINGANSRTTGCLLVLRTSPSRKRQEARPWSTSYWVSENTDWDVWDTFYVQEKNNLHKWWWSKSVRTGQIRKPPDECSDLSLDWSTDSSSVWQSILARVGVKFKIISVSCKGESQQIYNYINLFI